MTTCNTKWVIVSEDSVLQQRHANSTICVARLFQKQALWACHDNISHLGKEHSLDLLRDRFYWPNLASDVEAHIHQCDCYQQFKAKPQRTELSLIKVTHPLELVHMDFLTVESGKNNKDVNILVVTNHFTKYSQAHVTPSQTAQVVARTLWENFFMHYGMPEKLLNDQGRNFESQCWNYVT